MGTQCSSAGRESKAEISHLQQEQATSFPDIKIKEVQRQHKEGGGGMKGVHFDNRNCMLKESRQHCLLGSLPH